MVRITSCLWKTKRTFFDSARIIACGGRGGNGLPKYGGVGGKGGDVYLEVHEHYTLKQLKLDFPDKRFSAEPGEHSRRFAILGAPGKDCIIKCPPGISVLTDQKIKIGEVDQPGEKLLVCKGGRGGGPDNEYIGEKGQVMPITLDLKLLADVGFVGFPNAGKSTLLSAISNAKPKIANYPFTTIQPSVGTICYSDMRKITAADLPGLIEGSHLNRGMGHKFLKHCLRTQILLFVVDINGFRLSPKFPHRNAVETILYLNKELEMYNKELVSKPAILVINKCDTDEDGTKFEAIQDSLKVLNVYSSNLQPEMKPEKLIKFDAVLSISAKQGTNISLLKDKLRTLMDIYNEEKEMRQKEEEMKRKKVIVCTNPKYDVVYV